MSGTKGFSFEDSGIAKIFKLYRLEVPLYQREYSWTKEEFGDLFTDLQRAKTEQTDHFLGKIVTINQGAGEPLQIVDGQQRLPTTSLLIAAIRDEQKDLGRPELAVGEITRDYLSKFDIYEDESVLGLNLDAPVKYKGISVGKVSSLNINPKNSEQVEVLINVLKSTPISSKIFFPNLILTPVFISGVQKEHCLA